MHAAGLHRRDTLFARLIDEQAPDGKPRDLGPFRVDAHCMELPAGWTAWYADALANAHAAMTALEAGELANPDEKRMVGHYWLRDPGRAPTPAIREEIERCLAELRAFVAEVFAGRIAGGGGQAFRSLLVVGIGGSALGPELAAAALTGPADRLRPFFFDNTDPDGMDRTLAAIAAQPGGLAATLTVVISKSGGTKETRNGQLYAQAAYTRAGLDFARHAVAVTGVGSELYKTSAGWLRRFPMWDFVGGRTSELSAVGLLPAALQGIDIDAFLAGARAMDALTRRPEPAANPAMLLAVAWHHATEGRGKKDMVILPYKDRLELFSRYLQQLVMESLGKEHDLGGRIVNQGIAVYGNKGSTDQHAYVQQLRDGVNNFFVTFIQALRDREHPSWPGVPLPAEPFTVEEDVTSGDYLLGFQLGTEQALFEKGRRSLTLTVPDCSAASLGALIALYERAVGIYAQLVGINAYHQPGVEAGKVAAAAALTLQRKLLAALTESPADAAELATRAGVPESAHTAWRILEHLAHNGRIGRSCADEAAPFAARYRRA